MVREDACAQIGVRTSGAGIAAVAGLYILVVVGYYTAAEAQVPVACTIVPLLETYVYCVCSAPAKTKTSGSERQVASSFTSTVLLGLGTCGPRSAIC